MEVLKRKESNKKSVEVLLSTMNQNNYKFIDELNLNTNALVINQCDKTEYKILKHNSNIIRVFSTEDRGIGISRNMALNHAEGKFVIFADDDIEYVDNYDKIIVNAFEQNPQADGLVFNIITDDNSEAKNAWNKKNKRIHLYNCNRYGTIKFAFKLSSLRKKNMAFSQIFGASIYSSGEDTIFLSECIKKGLKIYAVPDVICLLKTKRESTYFRGFNEKFFYDKGAFLKANYPVLNNLFIFLMARKFLSKSTMNYKEIIKYMLLGKKGYKELKGFKV